MSDDDLIGRLAVNRHGARLEAIARIRQLESEREELRFALSIASRRNIDALRNAQAWAGSDAVWMERAQKAEARLAHVRDWCDSIEGMRNAYSELDAILEPKART